VNPSDIEVIAVTDCGSTTTKAILIEKVDGVFRQTARGDAPTTVEAPEQDVTKGVLAALECIAAMRGRPLIDEDGRIIRPSRPGMGVDLYLSTSSAGGGLQMMVAGVVRKLSAKAAERAALGAGAIVADVIACDDVRPLHEQMERIRKIRPDMVLLSGGVDGGAALQVIEMAELLAAANPRPRFGDKFRLPVIYAGNADVRDQVMKTLDATCEVHATENLLKTVDDENLGPAREQVHELFLDHVMREAPGFGSLTEWTDEAVVPTPSAVGTMLTRQASVRDEAILCVDIGGATTDIFSVVHGYFTRTVSANLGMSYSATNVLLEAGFHNVSKWLPFSLEEPSMTDLVMNKTVRPTTIPDSAREVCVEHALAREALGLALRQHRDFTADSAPEDGRGMGRLNKEKRPGGLSMGDIDLIIGSGGVISHAPHPAQAMAVIIDGFEPEGITRIAKDAIFMLPHLGILADHLPEAAQSVFDRDCLKRLGTCVAPTGRMRSKKACLEYQLNLPDGSQVAGTLSQGQMARIPLAEDESGEMQIMPSRGFDVGNGPGKSWKSVVTGGPAGIVLDGRGRPIQWPEETGARRRAVSEWYRAMGVTFGEAAL
jgi:uncharacterized protein (TIGR01319 family)